MKNIISLDHILCLVCEHYDVTIDEMKGSNKKYKFVLARFIYCYLAFTLTDNTLVGIGKKIDRRHSNVLLAKNKINEQRKFYRYMQNDIDIITSRIKSKTNLIVTDVNLLQISINYTKSFLTLN